MYLHGLLIAGLIGNFTIAANASKLPAQLSNSTQAIAQANVAAKVQQDQSEQPETAIAILGEITFPGKGQKRDWEQAGALQDEAVSLTIAGKYDEAIRLARNAISIYPHDYCFHNTLGIAYAQRNEPGDLALAQQSFEASLRLNAEDPMVWDNLGKILEEKHEYKKAQQAWLKCLSLPVSDKKAGEINGNIQRCGMALSDTK